MAKRLWQPFYETLNQIKNFNIEHQSLPVFADTAVTEFKQLNTGLSSLIQANLIAYQKQQEFIENAAHELQNPLAVFQSKLDLLVQEPTLLKGQVVIISSLYESASRLSRINKNLLLLAKLDNKHFIERQEVEAGEMLKEVLPNFTELAELKGLFLNMDLPVQPIWVQGHKGLLELMVNNLILNAIRHNIPAGNIGLKLTGKRFTIANTGEGVALSSALLYKRFAKTSFSTQGTGLGLAIVHQICQLHGWQITYQFTDQQHQFSVIF
jgi:signal transduction histidine kinase